mgnify:CR=1 FL=1
MESKKYTLEQEQISPLCQSDGASGKNGYS